VVSVAVTDIVVVGVTVVDGVDVTVGVTVVPDVTVTVDVIVVVGVTTAVDVAVVVTVAVSVWVTDGYVVCLTVGVVSIHEHNVFTKDAACFSIEDQMAALESALVVVDAEVAGSLGKFVRLIFIAPVEVTVVVEVPEVE